MGYSRGTHGVLWVLKGYIDEYPQPENANEWWQMQFERSRCIRWAVCGVLMTLPNEYPMSDPNILSVRMHCLGFHEGEQVYPPPPFMFPWCSR